MSPVTVAGTVAQTLAEALAGMALVQLVNPGAPVVLGSFASSLSMQSGAPTFGTPEPALVLYCMAALARRLGVPFRSGGALCASKIPDAQAAFESANTLLPTCLAGVNFVLHTAGWLEGGLSMGYEKFVMDADQAGMMHTLLAGVDLSDNGQALDAIREVGPGKHFLGCAHTQANFETAFYRSPLADNNSYEQWEAEGASDMAQRANTLWKKQLAEYEAPPMDPAVDEALQDYIEPPQGVVPRLQRLARPGVAAQPERAASMRRGRILRQRCPDPGSPADRGALTHSGAAAARTGARGGRLRLRQRHDLRRFEGGGRVRDRHGLDEVRLESRLDRGLDLLHLAHQLLDRLARGLVEQRDARAGAGRIAGRADLRQIAVRNHAEDHGVFDVDVAAEGAGEADAVDLLDAEVVHQQPHARIERSLGELDRAHVVLGDLQRHRAAIARIGESAPAWPRCDRCARRAPRRRRRPG